MRVNSGKYRGKRLFTVTGDSIRPTSDKVKQAVFNVLQFNIEGREVLDLFCGSGAMGIEALSRGCGRAVFNDAAREPLRVLKKNLEAVDAGREAEIYCMDYLSLISMFKASGKKFDIVFIDPPYGGETGITAVNRCQDIAAPGAVLVHEYLYQRDSLPKYSVKEMDIKTKRYGVTAVDFIYL